LKLFRRKCEALAFQVALSKTNATITTCYNGYFVF
jgi:hypothetical protein